MGLPMVQVFMIMARQLSKPVSDTVMRYGKSHPMLRDKVLVPVGRRIVNFTTRLRMRNLGLGAPSTLAPVSEAVALEQASEFVQQIVIFGYSVGVFAAYHYYSKANERELVVADDFRVLLTELDNRFEVLGKRLNAVEIKIEDINQGVMGKLFRSKSEPVIAKASPTLTSSIPFDEALKKVMPDRAVNASRTEPPPDTGEI